MRIPRWNPIGLLAHSGKRITFVSALFLSTLTALAQSSSSGVNGVVTDATGAVVSGAKVSLTNADTNVVRDTVSNASGDYFFTEVPPASYTLRFSATGFEQESVAAFAVGVAQVVTINSVLRIGSTQQSVTVQAANTQVESSSAQIGTVIEARQVNDLPLERTQLYPTVRPGSGRNPNQHRPEQQRQQYQHGLYRSRGVLFLSVSEWSVQPFESLSDRWDEQQQ